MQVRSKNEVFEEKRLFWFCMIVESDRHANGGWLSEFGFRKRLSSKVAKPVTAW